MAEFGPFPKLTQALEAQIHDTSGCPDSQDRICFFLLEPKHGSALEPGSRCSSTLHTLVTEPAREDFTLCSSVSSLAVVSFSCLLSPALARLLPHRRRGEGHLFSEVWFPQPRSCLWAVPVQLQSTEVSTAEGAERWAEARKVSAPLQWPEDRNFLSQLSPVRIPHLRGQTGSLESLTPAFSSWRDCSGTQLSSWYNREDDEKQFLCKLITSF